jgi:hypothetical protein
MALPGYDRLTGIHSAENWVDTATAVIDSAAFLNIVHLEGVYNSGLARWKNFKIGDQDPKLARSVEQELFSVLQTTAERAGLVTIDQAARAHHLIQGISLVIMLHGKAVPAKSLIQDAIAAARMGRAAVSRKFVFDMYEEQYAFNGHHAAMLEPIAAVAVDHALVVSADKKLCCIGICCKECQTNFDFTVEQQLYFKTMGNEGKPVRCKECKAAKNVRMAGQDCRMFKKEGKCTYGEKCRFKHESEAVDVMIVTGAEDVYSEGSDYDSDEGKPWRY